MSHIDPASATFSVRLARTAEEVLAVLATRFDVYRANEGMCNFDSLHAATGLDLCPYDAYAHHLALVLEANGESRVVGSMRVVMDAPSPQASLLARAIAPYAQLRARLVEPREAALPLLDYLVQAHVIQAEYDRAVAGGLKVAEPSRLAIRPEALRLAGRQGFRAGAFMVEAALAHGFFAIGLDRVFLDCEPRHRPLYAAYGFDAVAGAEAAFQPRLKTELLALTGSPASIPASTRPRIAAMARQLEVEGEIRAPITPRSSLIAA